MTTKPYIIGIAGPSGSGKTTLARSLGELFPNDVAVVPMDSYYHANWDLPFEEREKKNYDRPSAFDVDLMREQVEALRNNETIESPIYDFAQHQRSKEHTATIEPKKIIIVEGILLLHLEKIRPILDLKVFLSTPILECKNRRIIRDFEERGRTKEYALQQYNKTVHPNLIKYVIPSQSYADVSFEMIPGFQESKTFTTIIENIKAHADNQAQSA